MWYFVRMTDRIFGFTGPYSFLSNFYVEADGKTAEHRFQALKPEDGVHQQWVLDAPRPAEAKSRGRRVPMRRDWGTYRHTAMLDVLRVKFQDPQLRHLLLDTGDAELLEANTWHDVYWGVDKWTGNGENHLGKTLMQVREEIRNEIVA